MPQTKKTTATLVVVLFMSLVLSVSTTFASPTNVSTCKSFDPNPNNPNEYNTCTDLPVLGASLYWTYDPVVGTARIAFRVTSITSSSWISWGLNPTGSGMVGVQALVAFQDDGVIRAYTTPITSYGTSLTEANLSFPVSGLTAEMRNNEDMIIFATIQLPPNKTTINHVRQVGPLGEDGHPLPHAMHGDNLKGVGTIDFLSGSTRLDSGSTDMRRREIMKYVHGALCTLAFGVMMPFGVLMARYKVFLGWGTPAIWFKIHMACQISAYLLGMTGLVMGLVLGHAAHHHGPHMIIGIIIGCCATLQASAARLRPDKVNKYRSLWNIYHYLVGYGALALSAANIFLGLRLLAPPVWWKWSYLAYLGVFGLMLVLSVPINWVHNKKIEDAKANNANGVSNV